jgi:hypothetical protein
VARDRTRRPGFHRAAMVTERYDDGVSTGGFIGFNLQKEGLWRDEWKGLIANL